MKRKLDDRQKGQSLSPFIGLEDYIQWLSNAFEVWVAVKDLIGFSTFPPCHLHACWQGHKSPFCKLVKSKPTGETCCREDKYQAHRRAKNSKGFFFRRCYLGLGELLVPIYMGRRLIGSIACGHFDTFQSCAQRNQYLRRWAKKLGLDAVTLTEAYSRSTQAGKAKIEQMIPYLTLLSEYVSLTFREVFYSHAISKQVAVQLYVGERMRTQSWLTDEAIAFMKINCHQDIHLTDIAKEVCLSPYYFSRLFKKRLGISCRMFLNRLRIEAAKDLLKNTDLTVTEIAFKVGFNDSNYFTKVFGDINGIAPHAFRTSMRSMI